MAGEDTINLLKECNAGIKMGVNSIGEVLDKVESEKLRNVLIESKEEHQALGSETHKLLNECNDDGKNPNLMAQGMSWLKTNVMLAMDKNDRTVANLITDGCDMGIKSLNRYLNQYAAADASAKTIAHRLIDIEERLSDEIKYYL